MTGEITLRGRVLPIGGLKSKILAAHLSGAKIVILPRKNEKDLRDIPEEIRKRMRLVLVDTMEEVLEAALRRKPQPLRARPPRPGRPARAARRRPRQRKAPSFPPADQPPAVADTALGRASGRARPRSDRTEAPRAMEYRDYYATLGVPRTASQADIRKAFRRLAREHHPDVNKGDAGAEQRFKEVSEANEVLSDPEKRKAYDQLGANWEAYQRAGRRRPGRDPFAGFGGCRRPVARAAIRFEFHGDPEDLAGFSDFFRTFFAGSATGGAAAAAVAPAGAHGRPAATSTSSRSSAGIGGDVGAGHAPRASAPAALADVVPTAPHRARTRPRRRPSRSRRS